MAVLNINGKNIILDNCDINLVFNRSVNICTKGYARVGSQRLHRIIAKLMFGEYSKSLVVDHIDRNKLNNSRSNIRLVSVLQNNLNRSNPGRKFFGATYLKSRGKWQSQIKINGKQTYLGLYDTEYEAHLKYLQFAKSIGKI